MFESKRDHLNSFEMIRIHQMSAVFKIPYFIELPSPFFLVLGIMPLSKFAVKKYSEVSATVTYEPLTYNMLFALMECFVNINVFWLEWKSMELRPQPFDC